MQNLAGRPAIQAKKRQSNKIIKMTDKKIFPGFRAIGRAIGHDTKTAKKIADELGVRVAKRRKIPKRTEKQEQRQIQALPLLRRALRGSILIMDDESYFDLDGHDFFGGQYYSYVECPDDVPDTVRYRPKAKYGKKLLIWVAISSQGVSSPYFHECDGARNANYYIKNCIQGKLAPFVDLHDKKKVLFWPDLASCHYANATLQALAELKIRYVSKIANPPVVPMLRPIETFWSHLKSKVYANGFKSKNANQLKNRIRIKLKEFNSEYFRNLMSSVPKKVDQAIKSGLNSLI